MTVTAGRLVTSRPQAIIAAAGLALLVLLLATAQQVRAREELRREARLREGELGQLSLQTDEQLQELDGQIATVRQDLSARGVSVPPARGQSAYPPGSELTWILERARRQGILVQEIAYLGAGVNTDLAGTERVALRLGAAGAMGQLQSFVAAIPESAPTAHIQNLLLEGGAGDTVLAAEIELVVQAGPGTMPAPPGLPPTVGGAVTRVRYQLAQAWSAEDWPEVLRILAQLAVLTPGEPDLPQKFYAAHFNQGMRLELEGQVDEAVEQYALALARDPAGGEAQSRLQALSSPGAASPAESLETPALDPNAFEFFYVVQPGDTLFFIARSFRMSEEAILTRNAISGIRAGQKLVIRPPDGTQVMTIGEGQTLQDVATSTGLDIGYLMAVNRLDTLTPPVGLKLLVIPKQDLIVYRVQPGETIPDIAGRYGTTPDAIRSANRIQTLTPAPGTILYVPLA